ncbi:UNVERIFIED_CONTAM: protein SRG1 [Sesamum latifolium]|uniref:Protein SRG1 n=1 Tax=Sesamum latifolium TaxID=2727402 RepID=A0AAW2WPX8_9LAMI
MELSVQEMVKKPVHGIPKCYLVDPEPAIEQKSVPAIPVLDMKTLLAQETTNSHLHATCKDWGIFQLVNHGVETRLVEKLKYEIHEFYKLPLEERLRYKIRPGDVEGYGQTKTSSFPELPSSLRETLEAYIHELQKLARTLFGLIADALKIERTEVEEMFEDGMQSIRMNYYPPCPEPNKVHGLTPHSDATGLTILLQVNGVDGFQVKKDGVWLPVSPLPHAFLVNIGDVTEILSNGLYKSIEHRATVNSEKERITIAMFFNPKLKAEIGPSRSLLLKQPPLYKSMIAERYAKDFFSRKLNGKSFLDYMKI